MGKGGNEGMGILMCCVYVVCLYMFVYVLNDNI